MIISNAAWVIVLLFGIGVFVFSLVLYPKLEGRALTLSKGYLAWCRGMLDKLFIDLETKYIILCLVTPMLLFAMAGYFATRGFTLIEIIFPCMLGFIGWNLFRVILNAMWAQRMKKFDEQLVDALNLLANSLKAGMNLSQSLGVLVDEMPDPMAQEFRLVLSQEKLGLTLDDALEKMLERLPSDDLAVAINSVLILRETGGDLSETFEGIAHTIRERRKVNGKIESLTAQGKTQGLILFFMPFGFAAMIYFMNPGYITPLFTTMLGWIFLICAMILQVIGGLWIKNVISIDI